MNPRARIEIDLASALAGVLAALFAFDVMVWLYGESPRAMVLELVRGTWGTPYGIGQVLFKATPLLFAGLAVEVAFRAKLFNVGVEGQLAVASLAVGVCGSHLGGWPSILAWTVLALVAMAGGALWALGPALLRARLDAHEVITTIVANRVSQIGITAALAAGLAAHGSVRTADLPAAARLPRLATFVSAFEGSAASVAVVAAVLTVAAVLVLLPRTRFGREIELLAKNPTACRAEKIPVDRRMAQALVLSGAIAGLGSLGTVLGYKGYYEQGLGAGAGFTGIAVAMLGRGRVVPLIVAALLFGTLAQGGLAINAHVPMEMMEVLSAIVVVAVAAADREFRRAGARAAVAA
ncbi:ABC transporter permease [soil metagenome]